MSEVECPLLVGPRQHRPRQADAYAVPALLPLQAQACFAIHPPQSLMVHSLALTLHQHLQPPISIARLLSGQPHQLLAQRLIGSPRMIAITGYGNRQQPAYPALTGLVPCAEPVSIRPSVYVRPFFAITAFSISLSRLRSATSRFRREFSSSSDRNRCASLTSRPPYLAFHV